MAMDIAVRVSKVALAAAITGPAAGVREAGVQLTDWAAKDRPSLDKVLHSVQQQFTAFVASGDYSDDDTIGAFTTVEVLFAHSALTIADLVERSLDPEAAADELLLRGQSELRTLSDGGRTLVKRAVLAIYTAVIADEDLMKGVDRAVQQRNLAQLVEMLDTVRRLSEAQEREERRRRRLLPLEDAIGKLGRRVSPAQLVQARSGMLPFIDRWNLLGELTSWLTAHDGDEGFSCVIVGGRGGTGKTRLAAELCLAAERRGWTAGFLSRDTTVDTEDLLASSEAPRLVIVDYAENRVVTQLDRLMPRLVTGASTTHPVRVLLLVRSAPGTGTDRWRDVLRSGTSSRFDAIVHGCEVKEVDTILDEDRTELFHRVRDAFSSLAVAVEPATPHPTDAAMADDAPAPDLTLSVFNSPLMVVIAAYLAVHGQGGVPTSREQLLAELLRHEQRHWSHQAGTAVAPDLNSELQRRVVALGTLVGGANDEVAGAELLRLIPDLADATNAIRCQWVRWAHNLYSQSRWWSPLEPDLLGEHLVAATFTTLPAVITAVLSDNRVDVVTRSLDVLARAAANHPLFAATVTTVFQSQFAHLLEMAVEQSRQPDATALHAADSHLAGALARLTEVIAPGDLTALTAALESFAGSFNLLLTPLAVALNQYQVECCRALVPEGWAVNRAELALSLNNLSVRLGELGRTVDGLAVIDEAVGLYRELVAGNPVVYGPDLARSLTNISNHLANVGRQVEGLAAIDEAVGLYRELVAGNPVVYGPDLAKSLNNLANHLAEAGRPTEGLAAIEESVEIRRQLVEEYPAIYRPNLARSLTNLSAHLASVGRLVEGLAVIEEAVGLYQVLVAGNRAAYGPDLARSLNNLSNHLRDAGQPVEGLAAIEESVVLWRELVARNRAAYGTDLARSLNNLSNHLGDAGRPVEGLAAIEESVVLWRELVARNRAAYGTGLALSVHNLSIRLAQAGRPNEGLAAIEEAVELYRELAAGNPAAYRPGLTGSLHNLAVHLEGAGRVEEAARAIAESTSLAGHPGDG